ncbi:tryptophan synthase subunit alpha [Candidatus Margulisiibacteriota bacterium]
MTRIAEIFREKKPLIVYITAGDPSLKSTADQILALGKAGVDIIELGIPFSDPLADGPTIQSSHARALKAKTTLPKIMQMIKQVRKKTKIPLVLMGAYNLFYKYGYNKFAIEALKNKIDGIIIPDLPPEEAQGIIKEARSKNFATIFLASLTSSPKRLGKITTASTGFIYLVAVKGVTGARAKLDQQLNKTISKLKKITSKPVAVGFGISTAAQAKSILKKADGVIIGSSYIKKFQSSPAQAYKFIKGIAKGI